MELGVAAIVNDGGGIVGEAEELVDDVGTRLLGAPGPKVCAAADGDEELVPAAAGGLKMMMSHKQKKKQLQRQTGLKLTVYNLSFTSVNSRSTMNHSLNPDFGPKQQSQSFCVCVQSTSQSCRCV